MLRAICAIAAAIIVISAVAAGWIWTHYQCDAVYVSRGDGIVVYFCTDRGAILFGRHLSEQWAWPSTAWYWSGPPRVSSTLILGPLRPKWKAIGFGHYSNHLNFTFAL